MTQAQELLVKEDGAVMWVTLNRPESRNGLTPEINEQIIAAFARANTSATVRSVAFFGAGRSFCSGLDLKAAAGLTGTGSDEIEKRMRRYFHGLILAVRSCKKPTVAVVDGTAVGFGCDLALAFDLRFCSERARFGEVFIKRGLMPDGGGTFLLPRIVGLGRALDMMLTGRMVEAAEAEAIGLANYVVPADTIKSAANDFMQMLAAGPPLVYAAVKECVYRALDGDLAGALESEVTGQLKLLRSKDFMEGAMSFLQKRPPKFRGE